MRDDPNNGCEGDYWMSGKSKNLEAASRVYFPLPELSRKIERDSAGYHNGGQIIYSFVLMLISLSSLAWTSKFQKNICFEMRAVGLININKKECKCSRHLWKWPIES